ncbi:hypothetical protein [Cytobacillus sp. NCCP-133]|uniref:hypothetical protein n=1 Tax=Cytobacillus sp. NCCP-133 TaxID=766848 RepID=UPI002230277A|nr:hypothetical protein [Cytobacillus sp. NCCP-133]GLB58054.1 hypothetical protein NCCP133_01870 [Cytobacillus sp. NCCP-133]
MEAVKSYEKKQLASFYYFAGIKPWMGTGLLAFYCIMVSDLEKYKKLAGFTPENSNI